MSRRLPVPGGDRLRERIRALASGDLVPVEPKPASTVMLVRDGGSGVEVFVQRRVTTMAFAAGMVVFPGGGVDPRDADADLPWAGPSPSEWAQRLGTDEAGARVLVAAAVREVFEECGVLLAGPTHDTVVGSVADDPWPARRQALLDREKSLSQVLTEAGLVLRSDLLSYRAHWITPAPESRRYDTYFFAALAPEGQEADDATTEADVAAWVTPARLLGLADAGEAQVMPPTRVNLEEIGAASAAAAFVAEEVAVRTVLPVFVETEDGVVIEDSDPETGEVL